MKKLFVLPLTLLIASCVPHLSEQKCRVNWYNEGVGDAAVGHAKRDLKPVEASCARYDIHIDTQSYEAGWKQGLKQYCMPNYNMGFADGFAGEAEEGTKKRAEFCASSGMTLNLIDYHSGYRAGFKSFCSHENGMLVAKQGKPLPTICPKEWQSNFEAGWAAGRDYLCVKHTDMAYDFGKTGEAYPEICSPSVYPAFKAAYEQGQNNAQAVDAIEQQIEAAKNELKELSQAYALLKNSNQYRLSNNRSSEAQMALAKANELWKNQRNLELRLAQLNAAK